MANQTTQLTIRINGREVERTLNGMGRELSQLNREVRNMNEGDPEFQNRVRELQRLREEYNRLRGEVYGANNATSNFTSGLKGVGAGIAAAFTVDKVFELGKAVYENVELVRELKTELSTLTGLDGSQLSNNTISTKALADTYKEDAKALMETTNAVAKHMRKNYSEVLSELKIGFQDGTNISKEMLEQMKEYAPFIDELGGSIAELRGFIRTGVIDGIFNDKAADSVKEFNLRFREMTNTTRDALTNLGVNVEDMQNKIKSGQMSGMDALMQISKELYKLGKDSQVTGQVLADVFGGAGEDASYQFVANLHKMDENVVKLTRSQLEYNRVKDIELEANEKSALLFESLTGEGSKLNEFLANGKLAIVEFTAALFGIEQARASDDIRDQQVALKMLQAELLNTNTTTERRKQILNDLQSIYPAIFSNLDLEVATNEQLSNAIEKVNDSLAKRYQMQKIQEGVDDATKESVDANLDMAEAEIKLQERIAELSAKYNIKIPVEIQQKSLIEQTSWLEKQLSGKTKNFSFDLTTLKGARQELEMSQFVADNYANRLHDAEQSAAKLKHHMLGITPLQQKANETITNLSNNLSAILGNRISELERGTSNADPERAAELKRQAQEAEAARKRAQAEKKREAKRLEDQLKRERDSLHKELLKAEEDFQKKLKAAITTDEQAKLDLMRNGMDKELAMIRFTKDQKIQALSDEIVELEKLQKEFNEKALKADELKRPEDAAKFRELAKEQVQIIATKNSTIFSIEEKSAADSLIIYSKYRSREVELRQKAHDDLIRSIQANNNEELAQATTLEQAKQILLEEYGVEQLDHITTISEARNRIQLEQNKKMLDQQLNALEVELKEINDLLYNDDLARENGLQVLTDEDRDKQIENLKALGIAISEVKNAIGGNEADENQRLADKDKNARSQVLSGLDMLGFSADQWDQAFEGLKTAETEMEKFAAKIELVSMALQTVQNAWGMMVEAQNSALDRQVKKYEDSASLKTAALKKQLDEGYISQETYNAEIEQLEEDLAARKSAIAYKQAMNNWKMQLASNVSNTALAVTAALGTFPFGPQNIAMAAIVGGIGALQTGLIMANKPQRGSYYAGGDTKGLGYKDASGHEVAGVVHANEYVIPKWLLEDPVVANMKEFIEARRTGNLTANNSGPSYADGGNVAALPTTDTTKDIALFAVLQEVSQQLQLSNELHQQLLIEGVRLPMTMEAGKKITDLIDQYKQFNNKSKKS